MLSGIRVVEIAGIGPAPFCGMHLADLGADVVLLERPAGGGAHSAAGRMLHRGKRSVAIDLKLSGSRERVLQLVERADVLIEGMRPGAMERLGLGPQDCHARNQRLVYGRVTGWGQTGPLAQMPGHENNYTALSGALHYSGTPAEPPSSPVTLVGDIGGGALYLAIGVLSGVLNARCTGRGAVVDAAMLDGSAHMMQLSLSLEQRGWLTGRREGNFHDSSHFYRTYRCAGGGCVTLGALEPEFYGRLLEVLGLRDDVRFARQWDRATWPDCRRVLDELFATRTREQWTALLEAAGVCFAPVLNAQEAAAHPHNVARENFIRADGLLQAAPAPRFDGVRKQPGEIPRCGAQTQQIVAALDSGDLGAAWLAPAATRSA
jgi:alpha-methylacyl-CoA racemase